MNNNDSYLSLTLVDKSILESYKNMVLNLGSYLGEGYEIILHSLEDLHRSVIQIVNGHHSGRKIGAPITDLALSLLDQIQNKNDCSAICYMNQSKKGVPLRSTTIPITGEGNRIIGLLCINFYTDIPLSSFIRDFQFADCPSFQESKRTIETFADNTDELIDSTLNRVREQILNNAAISTQNKNKEIVIALYHKGIFNIKDSVVKVADLMGISKNTVYMHLRNIAKTEKERMEDL